MNRPDRTPLTRDRIIETAIRLADQHGPASLTMRRLGQELEVEAMSLYHHVNGREDLLEGMVATLVAGVRIPTREQLGPTDGWQAFLQHVAHDIRQLALAHPDLFPLIATRPPAAPWLRPPLRSLRLVDEFLTGLMARGLSGDHAVEVYKVFASFLLGHLLLQVSEAGAGTAPPDEPLDEGGAPVPNRDQQLSLDDYPTVRELEEGLRTHDADGDFERALESLLDHLDGVLSR